MEKYTALGKKNIEVQPSSCVHYMVYLSKEFMNEIKEIIRLIDIPPNRHVNPLTPLQCN